MKPAEGKSSTYIDFNKQNNKEGPKFKVGDDVRISNKNVFEKFLFLHSFKGCCLKQKTPKLLLLLI